MIACGILWKVTSDVKISSARVSSNLLHSQDVFLGNQSLDTNRAVSPCTKGLTNFSVPANLSVDLISASMLLLDD